jgi:hypothetical protein
MWRRHDSSRSRLRSSLGAPPGGGLSVPVASGPVAVSVVVSVVLSVVVVVPVPVPVPVSVPVPVRGAPPPDLVPDARVERIAGASHDVMLDAPERGTR